MRSKRSSSSEGERLVRQSERGKKFALADTHSSHGLRSLLQKRKDKKGMKLKEKIEEVAASGYILLWLLGVPIPVLLLFFLLRGCN
jgi:hypothetical protein